MSFPINLYGRGAGSLTPTVDQSQPFGTRWERGDGRIYEYAKAGATNLAVGKLMQQAATLHADYDNDLVVAAASAIGAKTVTVTASATEAITANYFAEGYLTINDLTAEGAIYQIKSHPAAAVGASCVLTLYDEDALLVALDTTSQVALRKHPLDAVIIAPTTFTGKAVGFTPIAVTAAYYFWLVVKGPVNGLTNGTLYVGRGVVRSLTTAGAVDHGNVAITTGSTAAADSTSGALVEDSAAAETVARAMGTAVDTTYDLGSLKQVIATVLSVAATTEYSLLDACIN